MGSLLVLLMCFIAKKPKERSFQQPTKNRNGSCTSSRGCLSLVSGSDDLIVPHCHLGDWTMVWLISYLLLVPHISPSAPTCQGSTMIYKKLTLVFPVYLFSTLWVAPGSFHDVLILWISKESCEQGRTDRHQGHQGRRRFRDTQEERLTVEGWWGCESEEGAGEECPSSSSKAAVFRGHIHGGNHHVCSPRLRSVHILHSHTHTPFPRRCLFGSDIKNFPEHSQSPLGLLTTDVILCFSWPPLGSHQLFLLECLLALFTRRAPVHPSELCQHARAPPATAVASSVNTDGQTLLSFIVFSMSSRCLSTWADPPHTHTLHFPNCSIA